MQSNWERCSDSWVHCNAERMSKPSKFTPEDSHWQQHRWSEAQKVPERIEDAAKFLATMISLSLTLALTVTKPAIEQGEYGQENRLLFALGCWLVALLPAFLTLMPLPYQRIPDSTDVYRKMHRRVVKRKYGMLVVSAFLFFCGFLIFFLHAMGG